MQRLLPFLFCFLAFATTYGQVVINEISYNPPESGNDSLEYIELYNASDADIDMSGYSFSEGVTYEFTDFTLQANSYVVVTENSSALESLFGISSFQWEGALKNGGELIALVDASGNLVDSLTYFDVTPWPGVVEGTDGGGATIELCDASEDNAQGGFWKAATNDTGVTIEGKQFLGTPGAANTVTCGEVLVGDYYVETTGNNTFVPAELTIRVGETVVFTNGEGFHNVNGTQEAFPNNPESFYSGAASSDDWQYAYTFNTAGVYDYQCDPHAGLGMVGKITVEEDVVVQVPVYSIDQVNTVNAEGVADSLDVMCILEGVVHGANLRVDGLQFALIDNGAAIGLFAPNLDAGYTYQEGDRISVTGSISQYNGLTQIANIEVIELISSGNELVAPTVVTSLGEDTESQLVELEGVSFVDVSEWKGDGSSFNVDVTDGTNTYAIRIDNDTELANMSAPSDNGSGFNIIGIGGQFDNQAPYTEGYQLFPRRASDFQVLSSTLDLDTANSLTVSPNPVQTTLTWNVDTNDQVKTAVILNSNGQILRNTTATSIDVADLSSGTYVLKVIGQSKVYTQSFVKY